MLTLKGITLNVDLPSPKAELQLLESSVLLPALAVMIAVAVVAGVVISAQKYKRY